MDSAQVLFISRKNGSNVTSELTPFTHEDLDIDEDLSCSLLVDTQTIEVVNRWRRERGDPELRVAEFAKSTTDHAS